VDIVSTLWTGAVAVPDVRSAPAGRAFPAVRRTVTYDFSGRTAVVTGGLQGIGAAVAAALRDAGAVTTVWDKDATDGPGLARVDIADPASVERAAAQLPTLDILVNHAGYAGPPGPLDAYPEDEWRRVVEINLVGTFNVCRALVPLLRRGNAARVVNVASLAGKEGTPNASAYSAAKAGVIALTKSLAKELVDAGVLVNAVAPAAVRTRLLEQMSPAHVQTMIDKSPMKRLIEPAEVAELVMWLCSQACTVNTGAIFDLSGGRATY
jgi:3-oxoacyl-[acyl-carrier protein] reductase